MRLLPLTSLCFAATALAAPAIEVASGAPELASALTSVRDAVNNLKGSLSKIESPKEQAALDAVDHKSDELTNIIKAAREQVEHASPASIIDALAIAAPADGVAVSLSGLASNLAAKKAILEKAGEVKEFAGAIAQQRAGSKGLFSAVMAKLPPAVKPIAQKSADQIDASLGSAADNFNSI
jgi:hypothetical protein